MSMESKEHQPVRWRQSVIFRVILLCAVLLMCLLGSVYVITYHYYRQVMHEMQDQIRAMADQVVVQLEEDPELNIEHLERDLEHHFRGAIDIDLNPPATETGPTRIALEINDNGELTKVARHAFIWSDRPVLLTTRVPLAPRTEVFQAFRNMYLLALTSLFVATLILMVYVIARTLRPLGQLSDSCAKISEGQLEDVTIHSQAGEIRALEQTFNNMVASLREKELMESNLRQAQRHSALGNLAAGIAHDIRNPLNAIKLLSSHGEDSVKEGRNGAGSKQFASIRREVARLEEIVSGFLSLAKETELNPQPQEVDALLEECLHLVKKEAEARNVQLVSELRAGGAVLMLDAKQWTRAILNVLINALEASPPSGRVRLFSRVTDRECEIEIRDDGPGMAPEVYERVFDPYYTTKSTGTGLGLSITRGIIEEHGGAISISSEPGGGCQVLITMSMEYAVTL